MLTSPKFLFRVRARSAQGVAPGSAYPRQRSGAGEPPVVLPLEQHSRRRAAGRRPRSGQLQRAGRRSNSRCSACWPIRGRRRWSSNFAGQWLYLRNLPGQVPNSNEFPDFDDNLRQAFRRETELFFNSIMREDRSVARSADGQLHVRERAAGAALRHPERLRQPLPPRRRCTDPNARRGCSARAAPDGDFARRSHVARARAASGFWRTCWARRRRRRRTTCRRSRTRPARQAAHDARADGGAPREPGVRELPQDHGSARARARELRRGRRLARARTLANRSTRRGSSPTARKVDGPVGAAAGAAAPPRGLRRDLYREAADLCAGPRGRLLRHADGAGHRRATRPCTNTSSRRS